MPRREGTKKQIIGRLVDDLSQEILAMDIGSKASIARLVQLHYELLGYESRHLGINHVYGWTKDSGKTYGIASSDLFEVLDCIMKKMEGKRVLDFSEYEDMIVGLPFNLNFIIWEAEQK